MFKKSQVFCSETNKKIDVLKIKIKDPILYYYDYTKGKILFGNELVWYPTTDEQDMKM